MADDIKLVIGVDDRDLIKAQKEQLKFQRNIITIEKAFRNGDITAKRYNQELNKQTKELQRLGGSYRTASSEVRKYAYAMRQADDATLAQSQAMAFAGKKINRMGVGLQQAGYQIGDFAVQIQGGTNAAVALGQQGSQLLGIFGPAGAIAGAALAITTAFAAPMLEAGKATEKAREEIEKLRVELELLRSGAEDQITLDLNQKIAKVQGEIFEAQNRTFDMSGLDAEQKKQLLGYIERHKEAEAEKLKVLNDQLDSLIQQREAIRINKALVGAEAQEAENIRANEDRDRRARVAAEREYQALVAKTRITMGTVGVETTTVTEAVIKSTLALGGSVEEAIKLQKALDSGKISATMLSGVDIKAAINPAVKAAQELAKQLGISLRTALAMSGLITRGDDPEVLDPRSNRYDPQAAAIAKTKEMMESGDLYKDFPKDPTKTKSGGAKKADPLGDLKKQLNLEQELIGKSEEYIRVRQALGDTYKDTNAATISSLETQIVKINEAREAEEQRLQLMSTVESSLEEGFMSMIDGTKSVKDAFRDMAREIIAELYRVLVVKRMVSGITSFLGFADGGAFSGGSQIQAYADGGVVGGPTFFPMSGGKTGLMGEAGPEAIMPLKRGANGKLGVQMEGGGGDNITVNQSFNFSANGDDSVKKLIAQAAPQIANMTQKQIMDSRRRGGAMKSTFG